MKRLLTSILVGAFAISAFAQEPAQDQTKAQEADQLQKQVQEKIAGELDNLNEEVKAQVQEAKAAMEQVQDQIRQMKADGKGKKQIETALEEKKTMAQEQLHTAIQKLDQVQAQVSKASEEVQKRLQERTQEMKRIQARKMDGSGKLEPAAE